MYRLGVLFGCWTGDADIRGRNLSGSFLVRSECRPKESLWKRELDVLEDNEVSLVIELLLEIDWPNESTGPTLLFLLLLLRCCWKESLPSPRRLPKNGILLCCADLFELLMLVFGVSDAFLLVSAVESGKDTPDSPELDWDAWVQLESGRSSLSSVLLVEAVAQAVR